MSQSFEHRPEHSPAHSIEPIDENHLLYGNFIGLQYAFETSLDLDVLDCAISTLQSQFPALSGRYNSKTKQVDFDDHPQPLRRNESSQTLGEVLANTNRPNFISQPKRRNVLKGRAPLSTFTTTTFSDGGLILAVAISHCLTDAAGYHFILKHLSELYNAIKADRTAPAFPYHTELDVFKFGTQQSKPDTLNQLKEHGLPKPLPISGLLGGLIKSAIIRAMDKSLDQNPPIKIDFTAGEVTKLKQTVLEESGEDWLSTNMALCAHITSIVAKLSYPVKTQYDMQIGQLLDLRNRYFEAESKEQSTYVGNAILIHIENAKFENGLQSTPRGELATYFKKRQSRTNTEDVKRRLNLLADCLDHGFTNPELDVKNPIISLNNQSKMPVYDIEFGNIKPIRIIPQDVGDNVMFFPAPSGGIEIYIRDIVNPMNQQRLNQLDCQALIYNF